MGDVLTEGTSYLLLLRRVAVCIPRIAIQLLLLLFMGNGSNTLCQDLGTGSIAGRVTVSGDAASSVTVTLIRRGTRPESSGDMIRTDADAEGRFQFRNVPAGTYMVNAFAPAFITPNHQASPSDRGEMVTLAEGETLENIDIKLKRGGAITGRIVGRNRQPVIEENVYLLQISERGEGRSLLITDTAMYKTDDRGVYRIYGLPAGRYKVYCGIKSDGGAWGSNVGFYNRVFYSGVSEESEASVISLQEGAEASGIDLVLDKFSSTYSASGLIVDTKTSQAIPGVSYGFGVIGKNGEYNGSIVICGTSAAEGEFHIPGLPAGRYAAFALNDGSGDVYSEPTPFVIKDTNLKGVEIKLRPAVSIEGIVVFEGSNPAPGLLDQKELQLIVRIQPTPLEPRPNHPVQISAEGRFHLGGLPPGVANIFTVRGQNVSLLRVEQEGVEKQVLDLREGQRVTGLRVVLSIGTGTIRGEVRAQDGEMPGELFVVAQREGIGRDWTATVDIRGHFVLEGMPWGQYDVTLSQRKSTGTSMKPLKQKVTVSDNTESRVVFDVGRKN